MPRLTAPENKTRRSCCCKVPAYRKQTWNWVSASRVTGSAILVGSRVGSGHGSLCPTWCDPVFRRPFVKRFVLCHGTVVCPVCLSVCLSVTLVYCGQTLRWIRMPLGTDVGLGPGHIVLWKPSSPTESGTAAPTFGPCLLWPNDWMVQDAIWYGGRPWPRRHCAIVGIKLPPGKGAQFVYAVSALFRLPVWA